MRRQEIHRWPFVLACVLLAVCSACRIRGAEDVVTGDAVGQAERGKDLFTAYGCGACHQLPNVSSYPGHIGPPLTGWSQRKYIAGRVPNEPRWLIRWIMDPQEIEPGTAMPRLGVTEPEARDIAAYLYSH